MSLEGKFKVMRMPEIAKIRRSKDIAKTLFMIIGLSTASEYPFLGTPIILSSGASMINRDYLRFLRRLGLDTKNCFENCIDYAERYIGRINYACKMKKYGI